MLIYDIETNGLLDELTVIHCLHVLDRATGERMRFSSGRYADGTPAPRSGSVEDGLRLLSEADNICGHNVVGFDNKAILKLYPDWHPKGTIHDTLVYSRLIWSNIKELDAEAIKSRKRPPSFTGKLVGAHSLEAWGIRLGVFKGDYAKDRKAQAEALGITDPAELTKFVWGTFTKEMDDYCEQDVVGTDALYDRIARKEYDPQALALEMEVARIISMQEDHGFLFDIPAAEKLMQELSVLRAGLEDQLRSVFKPWWEPERKGGQPVVMAPKKDLKRFGYTADCAFSKVEQVTFNPGSRHHIANRMKTMFGWVPVEFTPSGEPKVDETTLAALDYPEAKLLVEYLTVQKRLGQIAEGDAAWLRMVRPDGRIHGRVNPNGAVTGRMTHFAPNVAQVPSVGALFGSACRACFTVPKGFRLVGCDAEGLELRMLGHYMARYDGGAYANSVVHGKKEDGTDVHTVNMRIVGLRSRDSAKTFIYAYLYGAGAFKLGTVVYADMTPEQQAGFNAKNAAGEARNEAFVRLGRRAKAKIEGGLPALGKLQELVKEKAKRGFLKGLDGRLTPVRSQHAALNTLLQGAGAVVMKQALVILYNDLTALGLVHGVDYGFCANVHDEVQIEVKEAHVETVKLVAADAIRKAGEHFNLQCPLAGKSDDGKNWAETH